MAAATHTQGPWEYRELEWNRPEDKGDAPGSIVSDDGWFIATVEQMSNHTEGNARLLAAAPELLDALQAARQQIVTLGGDIVEIDGKIVSDAIQAAVLHVIDAAINAAKGIA